MKTSQKRLKIWLSQKKTLSLRAQSAAGSLNMIPQYIVYAKQTKR